MTTQDVERCRAVVAHERRATRSAAEHILGGTWYIGIGFWVISLIVAVVLTVVTALNEGVEINVGPGPAGSARFFIVVMTIILPLMMIELHLAAGGTRRTIARGFVLGSVAVGVSFAAVSTILASVQPVIVEAIGGVSTANFPGALPYFGAQVALCVVYALAGCAVSVGYYRFGGWYGTLLLIPLFVPSSLVEYVTGSGYMYPASAVPVWGGVAGSVVGVLASAWSVWLIARNFNVHSSTD